MCATTTEKKANPARSAAASEVWRKRKRAGVVPRFGGLMIEGIAEDGSRAMTKELAKLGIYKRCRGIVSIHFRVDETGPKRVAVTDTCRAVRMTKHIEENYVEELNKNDRILKDIAVENLKLAKGEKGIGEIKEAIEGIREVLKWISRVRVPKKVFSREQAKQAVSYLEDAIKDPERIDGQKVIWACTKLVSFRTRYGKWRDEEVIAMKEYSKVRGYALRKLRDEWILYNISNWVRYLEKEKRGNQMRELWRNDFALAGDLEKIIEKNRVDGKGLKKTQKMLIKYGYNTVGIDKALKLLADAQDIKETYAEMKCRLDKKAKEEMKGLKKEAWTKVRNYMLLLRVRNPLYLAKEMEKETDSYYHKAASDLKAASLLIERRVYGRAVKCLEMGAKEIKLKPQTSLAFPSPSR